MPIGSQCTSNYIVCVHGTAVYQPCPSPLVFSPLTLKCEYAGDVPACGISQRLVEGRGEIVIEQGSGSSSSSSGRQGGVVNPNVQPASMSGNCQSMADGDYPIEPCSRTYRSCGAGISYPRECPPGLVFDGDKKRCDHPEQCGGSKPTEQQPTPYRPISTPTIYPAPRPSTVPPQSAGQEGGATAGGQQFSGTFVYGELSELL